MHFTRPSYRGSRAFSASRLSPWMIMFSLPLRPRAAALAPSAQFTFSPACWPFSSKLYWRSKHPEGHLLMVVDDLLFSNPFQCGHGSFLPVAAVAKDLSRIGRAVFCPIEPATVVRAALISSAGPLSGDQRFQHIHDLAVLNVGGVGKLLAVLLPHGFEFPAGLDVVQNGRTHPQSAGRCRDGLRWRSTLRRIHSLIKFLRGCQYVNPRSRLYCLTIQDFPEYSLPIYTTLTPKPTTWSPDKKPPVGPVLPVRSGDFYWKVYDGL